MHLKTFALAGYAPGAEEGYTQGLPGKSGVQAV